jgi:hypothetical protein
MLVVVALMFFDEEARFDAPTVAGTEVAALRVDLSSQAAPRESSS